MKEQRTRNFSLVSYLPREVLEKYCLNSCVAKYALIEHDKDKNDDGTPKANHFHVVLTYVNTRTLSAVKKDFADLKSTNEGQNTLVEVCRDLQGAYDYLTHSRCPNKAQYDRLQVFTNVGYFRGEYSSPVGENKAYECVCDILDGLSTRELLKKYGYMYVMARGRFYECADQIRAEESDYNGDNHADELPSLSNKRPHILVVENDGVNPFKNENKLIQGVIKND